MKRVSSPIIGLRMSSRNAGRSEAAGGELVVGQAADERQAAQLCQDADGVLSARGADHQARDWSHDALPHHRALRYRR